MLTYENSQESQLTLSVLKRSDPDISAIISHIPWTAIYSFGSKNPFDSQTTDNQWHRIDYEGSLFILERNTQPKYQFLILNRKNANNFVQTIQNDFQLAKSPNTPATTSENDVSTDPSSKLVIYKVGVKILGLWFYREEDKTKFTNSIKTLIAHIKTQQKLAKTAQPIQSTSNSGQFVRQIPQSAQHAVSRQTLFGATNLQNLQGTPPRSPSQSDQQPLIVQGQSPGQHPFPSQIHRSEQGQVLSHRSNMTSTQQFPTSTLSTNNTTVNNIQIQQPSSRSVPIWTKEDLKANLLVLCENDQFIDLIYQQFVTRLKQAGY